MFLVNGRHNICEVHVAYHNDDVSLAMLVKAVHELREFSELLLVVSEHQFPVHVVYVTPLHVLEGEGVGGVKV